MGRLARFFVGRRAAGDPYEATLVLPALIVIIVMRLNSLGRLDDWTVIVALVATAIVAGAWVGASLGERGMFRAVLRGITVGAIEAAGFALVYREKFALTEKTIVDLIFVNLSIFWYASFLVSTIHEFVVTTEKQWQIGRARRASFHNFIRIVLGLEELKGQPTPIGLMVWITRALMAVITPFLLALIGQKVLEFSPNAFLHPAELFQSPRP